MVSATQAGLIADYHFDGDARDSSGFGHHGLVVGNSVRFNSVSPTTTLVDFDNPRLTPATGYIELPQELSDRLATSSFTIGLSTYHADPSIHGGRMFGTTVNGSRVNFVYRSQTTGRPYWEIGTPGQPFTTWWGDPALPELFNKGLMYFWLVNDRAAGEVRLFVNGEEVSAKRIALGSFAFDNFFVGAINGQTNAHGAAFAGVDRLLFFDTALTAPEIRDYEAAVPEPVTTLLLGGLFCLKTRNRGSRKP